MSTQSLPWFRMYTDFLMDPKMIALAFEDQRHFIGILALKADGALDQDCCPDLMDRIVAQRLWIDHAIIRDVKKRLIAAGLIDEDWQPLAWNKRQMRSDADPTNAERQRRYRERQKAAKEAEEKAALEAREKAQTQAQTEAEQAKKEEGKDSNALRNAPVTHLDIDTDIDKDKDNKKINKKSNANAFNFSNWPTKPDEDVWADYVKHRQRLKAPLTQTAVTRLGNEARKAADYGFSVDDFLAECMMRGWRGGKAEWLRGSSPQGGTPKHSGFSQVDYNAGVDEDGNF